MRKSELYARYNHWNEDIQEIDILEFHKHFIPDNKDHISFEEDGSTYITTIRLEGWDYISYSSHWKVGWQGDVDSDQFYCKQKRLTHKELEELSQLFG